MYKAHIQCKFFGEAGRRRSESGSDKRNSSKTPDHVPSKNTRCNIIKRPVTIIIYFQVILIVSRPVCPIVAFGQLPILYYLCVCRARFCYAEDWISFSKIVHEQHSFLNTTRLFYCTTRFRLMSSASLSSTASQNITGRNVSSDGGHFLISGLRANLAGNLNNFVKYSRFAETMEQCLSALERNGIPIYPQVGKCLIVLCLLQVSRWRKLILQRHMGYGAVLASNSCWV